MTITRTTLILFVIYMAVSGAIAGIAISAANADDGHVETQPQDSELEGSLSSRSLSEVDCTPIGCVSESSLYDMGRDEWGQSITDGAPDGDIAGTQTKKADGVLKTKYDPDGAGGNGGYQNFHAEREPAWHRAIVKNPDTGNIKKFGPKRCHNPNTIYC